jgi:hypothetical protein
MAANTVMQVTPNMVTFSRAATAASELFSLIDRESEINPFDESGNKPGELAGVINLQGIDFSYPTRPDVTVLENFTLSIPAGKVTALVVSKIQHFVVLTLSLLTEGNRDRPVQGKVQSSVCSNGGTTPPQAAFSWTARISDNSTSSGCGPTSV